MALCSTHIHTHGCRRCDPHSTPSYIHTQPSSTQRKEKGLVLQSIQAHHCQQSRLHTAAPRQRSCCALCAAPRSESSKRVGDSSASRAANRQAASSSHRKTGASRQVAHGMCGSKLCHASRRRGRKTAHTSGSMSQAMQGRCREPLTHMGAHTGHRGTAQPAKACVCCKSRVSCGIWAQCAHRNLPALTCGACTCDPFKKHLLHVCQVLSRHAQLGTMHHCCSTGARAPTQDLPDDSSSSSNSSSRLCLPPLCAAETDRRHRSHPSLRHTWTI